MPIQGIGSYGPTSEEIEDSWLAANGLLAPAAPLTLQGAYTVEQFGLDRTAMLALIDETSALAAQVRLKAGARDILKALLPARMTQFRGMVAVKYRGTTYDGVVGASPRVGEDVARFLKLLKDVATDWAALNDDVLTATQVNFSLPMTLMGGYTLAQFQADLAELQMYSDETAALESALARKRVARNNAMAQLYERMKQYRVIVPTVFAKNSPIVQTLPRLTPLPGTTPPAVQPSGAWDNVVGQARATWTALSPADIAKFSVVKIQVRGCLGNWKGNEEEVVIDLAADATHWEGDWGLTAPGSFASFKFYAMCSTGNENGGKALKIVRPMVSESKIPG